MRHFKVRLIVGISSFQLLLIAAVVVLPATPVSAAPVITLQQCANGTATAPSSCATSGEWTTKNLAATSTTLTSAGHYFEGHSVPYRLRITSLTAGTHNLTIQWDTTTSNKHHAFDYLTTFDRTVHGAVPCAGFGQCNPVSFSTFAIPRDPNLPASVRPVPGVFTLFNGNVTAVSAYTLSGDYSTSSKTSIKVTFSTSTNNVVLAFAAHVANRGNWGSTHITVANQFTPYKVRFLTLDGVGPTQERVAAGSATIADATPPICRLNQRTATTIEVVGKDTQGGLLATPVERGLLLAGSTNATVALPSFRAAETGRQTVQADKIDPAQSAWVYLKWTDTAGNVTFC